MLVARRHARALPEFTIKERTAWPMR